MVRGTGVGTGAKMHVENAAFVCVVAVERGAQAPRLVRELGHECHLLQQQSDEAPSDFAERCTRALTIAQRTRKVALGVVACAKSTGPGAAQARATIAEALVSAFHDDEGGELFLCADSEAPHELRQELLVLAGSLCERLVGRRIGVRVRFTEHASGVTHALPDAAVGHE